MANGALTTGVRERATDGGRVASPPVATGAVMATDACSAGPVASRCESSTAVCGLAAEVGAPVPCCWRLARRCQLVAEVAAAGELGLCWSSMPVLEEHHQSCCRF